MYLRRKDRSNISGLSQEARRQLVIQTQRSHKTVRAEEEKASFQTVESAKHTEHMARSSRQRHYYKPMSKGLSLHELHWIQIIGCPLVKQNKIDFGHLSHI